MSPADLENIITQLESGASVSDQTSEVWRAAVYMPLVLSKKTQPTQMDCDKT